MKVTYIDHMGTDLSVVNAARVSFGKSAIADDYERVSIKTTDDTREIVRPILNKRDVGLIGFLARGCTKEDWQVLVEEVTTCGYGQYYDDFSCNPVTEEECEALNEELLDLLNHIRRMPSHWTPFGHTAITLHIKAPIFVARQLGKHQVGLVWNEVSRRYVTDTPEFFIPKQFRKAAANVKQGSSDETTSCGASGHADICNRALSLYQDMLEMGVAPEQSRMVLPQSMYTEWYWTGNLYAFANVFIQRSDSHAQREVQEIAKMIADVIEPLFPVSWKELTA